MAVSERFRVFVAWPSGEIQFAEAGDGVMEAYEMMLADGVPDDKAAELAVGCQRTGKDPVAFAEHFTRVRREFRAAQKKT